MLYSIYKTTNTLEGKIYIGMHTTKDPGDSYLGSGTLISRAIKKYGRDAFVKEVLFVFATPEEMIAKEKELVTEEFVLRDDTYNLNVGGDGGWFHANRVMQPEKLLEIQRKGQAASSLKCRTDAEVNAKLRANGKLQMMTLHESGAVPYGNWKGRAHRQESKDAIARAMTGKQKGERNSNFGRAWIRKDGHRPKTIPLCDLEAHLAQGWSRGR